MKFIIYFEKLESLFKYLTFVNQHIISFGISFNLSLLIKLILSFIVVNGDKSIIIRN
jgi:Sec-independent protein secretion pathway component TatC